MDLLVNRLRVLDRLADDLAHEIKNPLNAVVINLELLKRRVSNGQTGDALDRADRVGKEVRRVHALVDALFQVMRPDGDMARTVDIDRLLRELFPLIELQAKLARVSLDRRPGGNAARVAVRPFTLRHAILNLIVGAIDASAGGWIELRTRVVGDAVELRVRSGAAPEALRAQEDRWAVVHALLRESGARIDTAADDDGATRVVLRLPRARY